MDNGRTTMIMIVTAVAITVAHRIGHKRRARIAAETARLAGCISWLMASQRDVLKGQEHMSAHLRRVETMTADLLRIGDKVSTDQRMQMRAVAGAYESLRDGTPGGPSAPAPRRLRQIASPNT